MYPKNCYKISTTQVLMTWRKSSPKKLLSQNFNMLMLTSKDSTNISCKKWLERLAASLTFSTLLVPCNILAKCLRRESPLC